MLEVEAALARALVRAHIAPEASAQAIGSRCKAALLDSEKLAGDAALAGNLAIPLVQQLTALVAKTDEQSARFVHWGVTSQDVLDTGLVLQLRVALALIESDLQKLSVVLRRLAQTYAATPLAGRTWLQQGPPITFGLKAAGWLDAVSRHQQRLREMKPRVLVLQFGGAVGTLAALEHRGLEVAAALAAELQLAQPDLPWHANRDRLAEAAATVALLVGSLGKIARDISLLAQSEIAEVAEPSSPGKGTSSTMPHKSNPLGSAVALAAALRVPALVSVMFTAMIQEHERAIGGWQAEWETLPEICKLAAGALAHLISALENLQVYEQRMAENLEVTRGLIFSEAVVMRLAGKIGRLPAHELVELACRRASQEKRHLREVLAEDARVRAHLSSDELARLFDPRNYLGMAQEMVQAVLQVQDRALSRS